MWFVALELLDRARSATHRGACFMEHPRCFIAARPRNNRQSNRIDKSERREIVGRVPGTS
jgi:hypothetical protein